MDAKTNVLINLIIKSWGITGMTVGAIIFESLKKPCNQSELFFRPLLVHRFNRLTEYYNRLIANSNNLRSPSDDNCIWIEMCFVLTNGVNKAPFVKAFCFPGCVEKVLRPLSTKIGEIEDERVF